MRGNASVPSVCAKIPDATHMHVVLHRVMEDHFEKLEPLVDIYRACCTWLPPWLRLVHKCDNTYISGFDCVASSWQDVTKLQRQQMMQATDATDPLSAFRVAHCALGDKTLGQHMPPRLTPGFFWTSQPQNLLCPLTQLASARKLCLPPSVLQHLARRGFATLADVMLLGLKHMLVLQPGKKTFSGCAGMSVGMATSLHAQLCHLSRQATQKDLSYFKSLATYPSVNAYDWLPHTLVIHWARQVLAAVGPFLRITTLAQLNQVSCDAVSSALAASWMQRKLLVWLMAIQRTRRVRVPKVTALIWDFAYGSNRLREFRGTKSTASRTDIQSMLWSESLQPFAAGRRSDCTRPDTEMLMRKFVVYKWMVVTVATPPKFHQKIDESAAQRLTHSIIKHPWLSLWHHNAPMISNLLISSLNITSVCDLAYLRQLDWDNSDVFISTLLRATLDPVCIWCRICEYCKISLNIKTVAAWIRAWSLHNCQDVIYNLIEDIDDIPQVLDTLLGTEGMSRFDRRRLLQASHDITASRALAHLAEIELDGAEPSLVADINCVYDDDENTGSSSLKGADNPASTGSNSNAEIRLSKSQRDDQMREESAKTLNACACRIQKSWRHWRYFSHLDHSSDSRIHPSVRVATK